MSKDVSEYLKEIHAAMEGLAIEHGVMITTITPKWVTSRDQGSMENYPAMIHVAIESSVAIVGKEKV